MSVKKILVILISVALLIGMTPVGAHATMGSASSADATRGFVDMPNDWSTPALQHAVDNGLLLGANGKLNPKGNLTRAEMATIIARVFNAQTKADISHFSDVNPGEWYSEYVAKAYQMQILKGSNGKMLPKSTISRQEAFVIIARALKLAPADQLDKSFSDTNQIANWAKNELFALVNAGYVAGSNGKLNPTGNITRAEFAQVMRNVIEHYIKDPGVISKDYSGNVMINVSDVVLTRSIIKGDLIIGDGVGNGDVTLDGVTITGRLLVRGGGIDSIHIIGGTHVGSLVISRVDGDVRVFVEDGTEIEVVIIEDGSDDVFLEGKFGTVTVVADNIMVDATKAKIANQVINGSNSQILIGDGPVNSGGNSGGVVIPPTVFVPVNEIFLNKADITLFTNIYTNDEELLAVSYNPSNATNKNTSWLSSNPEVATVTQNGVVRAVAVGEATITATSESGGKTATCIVTVLELGTKEGFLEDLNDTVESINVENISIFFDTETESFEVVFENENIDIDMVKVAANSVIESLKDYAGEDSKLTLTNSTGLFFKEFTLKDVSITEIAEFLLGVGGVSDFINNGRVDVTYNASVNYKHATINLEGSLVFRIKGSEEQFLTELSQKIDSVVNAALDDNDEKFVEAKMAEQDISILFANGVDIESVKTTAYNLVTSIKEIVSAGELIINGNTYDLYDELDLTQVAKDLLDGVSLSDFLEGNAVSKEYILNVVYREAHLSIEGNLYFGMLSFELLYYEQNISDDGYILLNSEKVLAKFNSTTNVEPNEIEGFTVKAFNQELIASDGSTVLKLYYDRNTFTVSFNENGGSNVTDITNVRYGTTVSEPSEPTKTGYSFGGWYKEAGLNNTWNFTEDTVNSATTLYAKWNPNTNTAYKVEHYQQAVSGTGYTLVDTENLIGTTEASVTAAAKTYTGFTENTNHENRVASGIIVGDGSTVLKLYYDRNTFTVSFDEKGGSSVADIANVRYGASISSPGVPTKTGYSFGGWYKEAGLTNAWEFNIDTVVATTTLYAKWNPNTNTAYKVEHYQQAVSGTGYTLVDTENLTGTTESSVTAAAKEYTGFTENTTHASRVESGGIAADGTLVLKLYYDRNTFTVSFNENGGSNVTDITNVRYGTTVSEPSEPTKTGYSFGGWYKEVGLTNAWDFTTDAVVAATTLYAKWNPNTNTAYKVEHYQQAVSGETYVLKDTEQLVGTTATTAAAVAKEYTGFTENTTHADRVASGIIVGDGSTVLKLYYDRNTFTVSFSVDGGSSVADITNVRYGATVSTPSAPTKTGYSFGGWYKEAGLTNAWEFNIDTVVATTTLYAKWNPNTDTAYKVEHYQQAVSGTGYTLADTENLTGTTGASATAVAKEYTGFTENTTHASRVESGEIAADGTLVLKLYYDRNTFTVSFSVDGGSSVADITDVRYGASISSPSAPTKTGYSFGGWYKEAGLTNAWVFNIDTVVTTTTLYAKWNPNADTAYKVEHYQQAVSGTGYALADTENLTGTTATTVTAVAKEYTGFTENTTHADRVASGIIVGDGSTVLKLYYDRNTFTVSFSVDGGSSVADTTNVRYGATVSTPIAPTKTGYSFGGWYKEAGLTNEWEFNIDTVVATTTLYAKWNPNTNTAYKVEHYQQAVSGTGYALADTENLTGTTEASVTAVAKEYTGFTENTTHASRVESGGIAADGTLVLKLYYDRNTFTVSFNENGGSNVTDITNVRYGTTVSEPSEPTKTGYSFGGWYKEAGLTNAWVFNIDTVVTTTTLYAKWNPNADTAYKVEHYQQAVSGTGYALADTENLTGTTATTVTAVAKEYTGFTENTTHADRVASGIIVGDGSTVLKLYYDRNTFTVSFSVDGGSSVADTTNVRYGATVSTPIAPTKTGYSFGGWYKEAGLTNEWEFNIDTVVATTTLYAKWNPNTNTAYKVEHYQQAVSGTGYALADTENLTGTTEASVTAVAKEYTGFTENTTHASRVESGGIAADGTLVLKLYYDRNTFTVSFSVDGGSSVADITDVRYGASISSPSAPTKTGYNFGGWYKEVGLTNAWVFNTDTVVTTTTLYAKWNPNADTAYKVEHYQQAVSGTGYALADTENLTGTTEASVTAVAKEYTGFTENTTHASRVESGGIAADGTLVLKLYYDRNTFTVSFNENGGSNVTDITNVRYGTTVSEPSEPTKTGYSFGGWYKEAGLTNAWVFNIDTVVTTTTLYAKWNPNADTAYKVEHYQQAVSGTGYALADTENLTGTTATTVTAVAKEYTGFTENTTHADRVASGIIVGDGSTVLKLYYDRNTFTVSFSVDGGSSVADTTNVRYGATVSTPIAPTKTGYSFGGWYKEAGLTNEWEFNIDTVVATTTLYAKWNPNTNTAYKVEHYQQAVSGTGYALADTENLTGTTEASVTAVAKEYTGFTENTTHASRVESGGIAADGTLVLKLYYDRNTFTVSFNENGGSNVTDITNVRYGTTVSEPSEPTKTGYSFGGWYKEVGLTNAWVFNTDTVVTTTTLYAKWNPNADTAYKVEHYQQAVSGTGYALADTENLTGTTDASATAVAKTYTGFTENTTHADRVASGIIVGDGSTVLKLYYDRDTFTVTFKNHDNSVLKTESVRYGGSATAPTPPERDGFEFTGWNGSFNNVTADVDVTAQYEPILRIGHEKIDGINYVNYSYTNNTVKTDTIRLPIYSGVTDVTSDYNITYYDKENGTEITSFNLADGGTTLKVYVVASSSQYDDYNGYVVFKYGSVTIGKNENYLTIEDALSKSKSGDIIYVKYNTKFAAADVGTFTYGYSESTPYVIKTGVTLLLPYDNTLETKIDKGVNNTTAINRNQFYVSLTLPEDIKLAVNGTLTVNALRGNASTKYMGIINSFNYSKLILERDSKVTVASNGSLNAIGFISGAGSVEALNGSTMVEAAFVKQFRGGTDTTKMPGTAFPFDQYTVANIEVPIKINAGSVYNASIMIYMSSSWYPSTLLIASNKTGKDQPLIKMDEGYALKTYDSINGNVKLELYGVASVNSTSVKIGSFSTNTNGKSLSFDGTWHIAVKENSNLSINTQIALLPGATMVVEDSATLTVASGGRLTVFNPYEYVVESSGYSDYPISSASYYRIAPSFNFTSTSPAVLSVAGSLVIENGGGVAGEINLVEGGQLTKYENTVDSYDYYYVTGSTKALVQKRTVQFLSSEAVNEIILVSDKYSGAIATTMNLKAIVRNGLGEPLNGIAVTFSNSKGTWSATGTTNSSGVATASATYSAAAKETGEINVEINNSNVKAEINYDYNGAYSCPLVYSYDGDVFNLEHEPVSYSVNRAFEDTTYGTLRKLQPVNDQYQIRITEEMDSQTFANGFSLYTVDYLETNEVKGIMADIFGNPHTIKERLAPKSFVDSAGNSWLREATTEGLIVTSSSDLLTQGQFVESYEAAFSRPEETSQIAKLMFHVKATEIVDMYGKWFTDLIDAENNLWWVEKLIEHPDIFEQFVYGVNAVTFVVELWNGNEWIVQGEIGAGSHLLEEFLVPLDLSLISDEADDIKVRLSGGAGFFDISQVSIDFSENRNMDIKRLDINSALKNGTEEVSTIIDDFSDNQRVKLVKGDYIDLYYEVPELSTGYNRGFIVAFKGYFHGAPYTVENTIVDIWGDMDFDDLVASILEEQPEAVEIMPNFMWLSELFRSVYTSTLEEKINKIIVEQVLR